MSEGRAERRLAAILAVDVAGYSRLMGADEEGTLAALRAIRRELGDPKIAEYRGRIVKTTGDGLLAEFASVVDAVRCAVEPQREMAARNNAIPAQRRIEFRMGINVGDIIIEDGDIFGDGVNLAARLEALAKPGGICLSAAAHEQVRDRLDLAFEISASSRLRISRGRCGCTASRSPSPFPRRSLSSGRAKARTRGARAPSLSRNAGEGEPRRASDAVGEGKPALSLPDKPPLAVLPFQNLTGDAEQEYFVDGMVEEIITAISRLPWLFVIARNSSFADKGKSPDLRQVGRELGSLREAGNRVRITGQLIDTTTGAHIWADCFDGELDDIFELQDRSRPAWRARSSQSCANPRSSAPAASRPRTSPLARIGAVISLHR